MCVIAIGDKDNRPSEEMIDAMWEQNSHGGGAAWREWVEPTGDEKEGHWELCWRKGIMKKEEFQAFAKTLPVPHVLHFRIASVGGIKPLLTHPFLIDEEATLQLEGRTTGSLLFHNGHWNVWDDKALEAAIQSNNRIPVGDWSDTRAMAWMIWIYGPGFMDLMTTQKGVLMTPKKMNMFTGRDGWSTIEGVHCSNDYFWGKHKHKSTHRGTAWQGSKMCNRSKCLNIPVVGTEVCFSCTQKEKNSLGSTDTAQSADLEGHSLPEASPVAILVGGSERPFGGLMTFTLAEVELLNTEGKVSKNKWKDFQKEWDQAQHTGNRALRSQKRLVTLSEKIAEKCLIGHVT